MTADWKSLCAELLRGLDENRHPEVCYPGHLRVAMATARDALAEPEPEGPTDEELWELYRGPGTFSPVEFARDVLARWGK